MSPLPPVTPTAALRARILGAARAVPAPARQASFRAQALAIAGGVGTSLAVLLAIGGPGSYGRPSGYYLTLALMWLGISLIGAWLGVARGRSMLGRPAWVRVLVALVTPLGLAVTAALAASLVPPFVKVTDLHDHLRCGGFATAFAVGPLVAFTFVRRGSDPVAPRVTGAAMGAVAGALGALGIELRCSHAGLFHVVVGHVVPVAALALLGAVVVSRFLALPRPEPVRARR